MFKVFYNDQFIQEFDILSEAESFSATLIDWADLPIHLCIKDETEIMEYQCIRINEIPEYYNA